MPRATRSRTNRDKGAAASTSRHSPASSSDTGSLALPVPSSSRNLRPRVHLTRSRTSSRRDSLSVGNSRVGSTTDSRSSSEFSNAGDSDGVGARERKRQRIETGGTEGFSTASSSSYLDAAPRPDWRNSGEYEDEDVDQLDNSDSEETRAPALSTNSVTQLDSAASTQRQSATPPPTAISPVREAIEIDPFTKPSSSSASGSTPSNVTSGGSTAKLKITQGLRETPASPVSSPSLMKIINETNIEPGTVPSKRKRASPSPDSEIVEVSPIPSKNKGKGKAKAPPSPTPVIPAESKGLEAEPLSEYTCPICFFPPSNATLTPCGHVCCGACLFTAVKTTLQRGANMGMTVGVGENVARCPVCRAVIPGWDGKGGGVIGIKVRQVISL